MKTKLKHTAEELDRAHREGLEKGRMEERNRANRETENNVLWQFMNAVDANKLKDSHIITGAAMHSDGIQSLAVQMSVLRVVSKRLKDLLLKEMSQ